MWTWHWLSSIANSWKSLSVAFTPRRKPVDKECECNAGKGAVPYCIFLFCVHVESGPPLRGRNMNLTGGGKINWTGKRRKTSPPHNIVSFSPTFALFSWITRHLSSGLQKLQLSQLIDVYNTWPKRMFYFKRSPCQNVFGAPVPCDIMHGRPAMGPRAQSQPKQCAVLCSQTMWVWLERRRWQRLTTYVEMRGTEQRRGAEMESGGRMWNVWQMKKSWKKERGQKYFVSGQDEASLLRMLQTQDASTLSTQTCACSCRLFQIFISHSLLFPDEVVSWIKSKWLLTNPPPLSHHIILSRTLHLKGLLTVWVNPTEPSLHGTKPPDAWTVAPRRLYYSHSTSFCPCSPPAANIP